MFNGITLESFNNFFKKESDCKAYLFDLKWKKKYTCRRCGNTKYWKGRTRFHTRCTKCKFDESVTSHTIFHKLQVPLLTAFKMAFHITALQKGISTVNLAQMFGINQKTAWLFKRKVQIAMAVRASGSMQKKTRRSRLIDGVIIMNRGVNLNCLQRINVTLEKLKSPSQHHEMNSCTATFLKDTVDPCQLINGHYDGENKEIVLWNFKQWLTGTHHHCSEKYFNGYLDEFFFKLSRRTAKHVIWHDLITAMVGSDPYQAA